MTPTEQNIAIAEACGWKMKKYLNWRYKILFNPADKPVRTCNQAGEWDEIRYWHTAFDEKLIPSYTASLDAIHEVEKVLTPEQRRAYLDWLDVTCGSELRLSDMVGGDNYIYALVHATTAQRAEAFLRTIGKWKD